MLTKKAGLPVVLVCLVLFSGCSDNHASAQTGRRTQQPSVRATEPAVDRLAIADIVPGESLANNTKARLLVYPGPDGRLVAESRLPSHRHEEIMFGARMVLDAGKADFVPPYDKLEIRGPSPNFTGGRLTPYWFSGAEHIFTGTVTIKGYTFESSEAYPLVFKVIKDKGYVYVCGRGSIKMPNGTQRVVGQKGTVQTWMSRAGSSDQLEREGASQALGHLARQSDPQGRVSPINTLIRLLTDSSYEVRRNALEALVALQATAATDRIGETAKKDADESVRAVAEWALKQLAAK